LIDNLAQDHLKAFKYVEDTLAEEIITSRMDLEQRFYGCEDGAQN
jgi:hypothetical protein